jgi:hypothetical protein
VAALLVAYAIWTEAWTFAVVVILLAVVYGLIHGKPHPTHTVQISEKALYWDERTIPWDELSGFWMLQGPGYVELHIEFKKTWRNRLIVQTGDTPPIEIATVLSRFIPGYTDRREKLLDYIIRICKL